MFPDNICQNIDILVVMNVQKNNFGFHSNQKTQGQKHQVNNLNFKYQVYKIKLRHFNTFLQFRLLFHEPHCTYHQPRVMRLLVCPLVSPTISINLFDFKNLSWPNCPCPKVLVTFSITVLVSQHAKRAACIHRRPA